MVDNNNVELNSTDLKQCLEDFCSKIQNGDFSQNQKEFSQLWKKYVNENSYDDFAEHTLITAYQCNSINYWKDLWEKARKKGKGDLFFEKFLSGSEIKKRGAGQFVIVLGVLSICINEFEVAEKFTNQVLLLLNNILPENAKQLDIKEFEIRFLKRINEKNLDGKAINNVPKKVLTFFKDVRRLYQEKLNQDKKPNSEMLLNKEKIDAVIALLSGQKNKSNNKKDSSSEQKTNEETNEEVQELKNKILVLKEDKLRLEKELEEKRSFYNQRKEEWLIEKTNFEKQLKAFQNSLENRKSEIAGLKTEIQNLNSQTELLSKELAEKVKIIQDKDDGIRILKESRDDRFEEKMKSIQERLIKYYGAFQVCREQQMTNDLGLVMRNYLQKVFDIIISNEIDLNK